MTQYLNKTNESIKQLNDELVEISQESIKTNTELLFKFESTKVEDKELIKKLENVSKRREQKYQQLVQKETFLQNHLFLYFEKSQKEFGIDVFSWTIPKICKHVSSYMKVIKTFANDFLQKHEPNITNFIAARNMDGLLEYIDDNRTEMFDKDFDRCMAIYSECKKPTPNISIILPLLSDGEKKGFSKELAHIQWVKDKIEGRETNEEPIDYEYIPKPFEWRGSIDVTPIFDYEKIPYDMLLPYIKKEMKNINTVCTN